MARTPVYDDSDKPTPPRRKFIVTPIASGVPALEILADGFEHNNGWFVFHIGPRGNTHAVRVSDVRHILLDLSYDYTQLPTLPPDNP